MKKLIAGIIFLLSVMAVNGQGHHYLLEKQLPKELKEISGVAKDGNALWVIGDNSKGVVYKLDLQGNVMQKVTVSNAGFINPEAISVDARFIYIGDVGDNGGIRTSRMIIRIAKSALGKNLEATAVGEEIKFTFPDEGVVKKKKSNNYDCEAMLNFGDSIYLFTKRREDDKTELYTIPKTPGTFSARIINTFKAKGLITDASINQKGNEVALVGYDPGHTRPFIWIFKHFGRNDFFSGTHQRFELTNEKKLDWQVESISYADDNSLFIACEQTKEVPSTLYLLRKKDLQASK